VEQRVDSRGKQELYHGFGNTMGLAVELAGTPALFAVFGWWLDHRLHTGHVLLIALFLFAITGMAIRTYYAYVAKMKRHEAEMPWNRR